MGKAKRKRKEENRGKRLVRFIYLLLRDRITAGALESTMEHFENIPETLAVRFTNKKLAEYAEEIKDRILK